MNSEGFVLSRESGKVKIGLISVVVSIVRPLSVLPANNNSKSEVPK